jgi:hypothetical protein
MSAKLRRSGGHALRNARRCTVGAEGDTIAPPVGAVAVKVTVLVPDYLTIDAGLTAIAAQRRRRGSMVIPAVWVDPEQEAVRITEVATLTVPAPTVNVAEVAPSATVTVAGTLAAWAPESDITASVRGSGYR